MIVPAKHRLSSLAALVVLSACASVPTGPTVAVLPGTGKSIDQFRADDVTCHQYALTQVGATRPSQATTDSGARSTAVGSAQTSAADTQRRFDLGYIQCVYARGHRVPVLGPMAVRPMQAANPPPLPPGAPSPNAPR